MDTHPTKDTLSSTPRTDAERMWDSGREETVVSYEFARQLERELNEAKQHNETLERSNRRLRQQVKP